MKSSAPLPFRIRRHHRRRTVRFSGGFRPVSKLIAALLVVALSAAPVLADGLYLEGVRFGPESVLAGNTPENGDYQGSYGMMVDFRFGGPDRTAKHADTPVCNLNSEEKTFMIIVVTVGAALGILYAANQED